MSNWSWKEDFNVVDSNGFTWKCLYIFNPKQYVWTSSASGTGIIIISTNDDVWIQSSSFSGLTALQSVLDLAKKAHEILKDEHLEAEK